jgi:hypothetical protein
VEDARWMLELSSPHISRAAAGVYRQLSLDSRVLKKSNAIIRKMLSGGNEFTRKEIMAELEKKGIATNDLRATYLKLAAELDMVVCNGERRGKQFNYALFDEKVPPGKPLKREDALSKLDDQYFISHGPATDRDFSWWSGLSLTDARKGLEAVKPNLTCATIDGDVFWYSEKLAKTKPEMRDSIHLLPAYDEYLVGYANRSATDKTPHSKKANTVNGIFFPTIVENGKLVGLWKRTTNKGKLVIELQPFNRLAKPLKLKIKEKAASYGKFIGMENIHLK